MAEITYFVLCCMTILCHAANLPSPPHTEQQETKERSTSPTISLQRYDGSTFYNFVKLAAASNAERNQGAAASAKDENDGVEFSDHDEDDADSHTTTLAPNTTEDAVVVAAAAAEDATQAPGNHADSPSAPGSSDSSSGSSAPESPAETGSDPTPPPGEAVPGQPGEAPSSSSSSESSSSSSSSSEEDDLRNAWEKAWEYKLKNELINRTGKSKDLLRIYSPVLNARRRFVKKDKHFKRI